MSNRRHAAERRGRRGEALAGLYLWLLGWRILARRVQTVRGEVDLVVRKGGTLCMVEVKWRNRSADLATAIDAYRLRRVAEAAPLVAQRHGKAGDTIRIDVILMSPWRWPQRIENAWMPLS